jgi:L-seryl-tRNA(Ser) seleniumtransferase
LQRLLPAGGDYSIAVASNFPAALTAFSLLVEHRQLVVHRGHAVRLPGGRALTDSFGVLLPVIQEVGSIDRVELSDFAGLESFCAIMADGGERGVELLDFAGRDAMQAVVLPVGTLASSSHEQIPSAESTLSAGADFVIMPGDGLCGGPSCGILVGRRQEIERIKESAAWPALAACEAIQAMMLVTLETAAASAEQVPVLALLNTSQENLRNRAERMATRLDGSDAIANSRVTTDEARLTADGRWRFPSQQLRLRHASLSADAWANGLQEKYPAVMTTVDGNDVCVDLRWIAAADDAKLAEALGGGETV